MEVDQKLNDRLERFEAGEDIEKVLVGLTDDESELVHLAAQIIALPKPVRNPELVRAQYQKVMQAAKQRAPRSSWFRVSFKWMLPASVFLLVFFMLTGIWLSTHWVPEKSRPGDNGLASSGDATSLPVITSVPDLGETPSLSTPLPPSQTDNPQLALLFSVHGIVQVKAKDGSWQTIQTAELQAGQTFRTWGLSSAEMVFFDGSLVTLDQNTQMTLELVNFEKPGMRQISLLQTMGESHHVLVPTDTDDSFYFVQTPNASSEVMGTSFQVTVTADQESRFSVVEGEVLVKGLQSTVRVVPGQITIVKAGGEPSVPVFAITTEGTVSEAGLAWVVNGTTFQTDGQTQILGKPEPGDVVMIQGRLLPDGSRLADRIEKKITLSRVGFSLVGVVDEMGVSYWTVSKQKIFVNSETLIDEGIGPGEHVLAQGTLRAGGEFLTTEIQQVDTTPRFEFSGLVEQINGEIWGISGIPITTDAMTKIIGSPVRGDIVHVLGQTSLEGVWMAQNIEKVSMPGGFEFIGIVEQLAPWKVGGVSLVVDAETQIALDIELGVRVRVEGRILEDGTWLVYQILNVSETQNAVGFYGMVETIDPWVVNEIALPVTENTAFVGEINVNSLVWVFANIVEDGSWQVLQIKLIETGGANQQCREYLDVILFLDDTTIILKNGGSIPRAVTTLSEPVEVGDTVWVRLCFSPDGTFLSAVISVVDISATPTSPSQTPEQNVTICHIPSGNPNNAQTITVDASSVDAHLSHGDYLGPCQESSGEDDGNPGNSGNPGKKDDKDNKGGGNNK